VEHQLGCSSKQIDAGLWGCCLSGERFGFAVRRKAPPSDVGGFGQSNNIGQSYVVVGGSWCLLGGCSTSDAGRCLAGASSAATAVPSLVVGRAASLVLCGTAGVFALGA